MKASCVNNKVIGHQNMASGSCSCLLTAAFWALMSFLHFPSTSCRNAVVTFSWICLFSDFFKTQLEVVWTPCLTLDLSVPVFSLSGYSWWSLRAGHGRQDRCYSWLHLQIQVGGRGVSSPLRQRGVSRGERETHLHGSDFNLLASNSKIFIVQTD